MSLASNVALTNSLRKDAVGWLYRTFRKHVSCMEKVLVDGRELATTKNAQKMGGEMHKPVIRQADTC